MSNIFTLNNLDTEGEGQINIDDLYEKKREKDLKKLELFKKQLALVHKRIKDASHQKENNTACWYVVPEYILGVSKFDNPGCIAYLMDMLEKNKFLVKYYHPNAIYISWHHWMPAYVRAEIKKKYGINVDEFGRQIIEEDEEEDNQEDLEPEQLYEPKKQGAPKMRKDGTAYTPVDTYRQMGNMAYKQSREFDR